MTHPFSQVIFNVKDDAVFSIIKRNNVCNLACFDTYLSSQRRENTIIMGFPEDTHLQEFFNLLEFYTGIKPIFIPEELTSVAFYHSKIAFFFSYPEWVTTRKRHVLNYLLHQLCRIPTIAKYANVGETKNFQEMLDEVSSNDPYWGFNFLFYVEDLLKNLRRVKTRFSYKQSSIVRDILSPFGWTIDGGERFIKRIPEDIVILAYKYNQELYAKMTQKRPVSQHYLPESSLIYVVSARTSARRKE